MEKTDAYVVKGSLRTNLSNFVVAVCGMLMSWVLLWGDYYILGLIHFFVSCFFFKESFKKNKDSYIKLTSREFEVCLVPEDFHERFAWKNIDKIVIYRERDMGARLKIMKIYTRKVRLYDDFPVVIILDNFKIDVEKWCSMALSYNPKLNLINNLGNAQLNRENLYLWIKSFFYVK